MSITTSVQEQLAAMRAMTPGQLREQYRDLFGEESRSGNRQWLYRRQARRVEVRFRFHQLDEQLGRERRDVRLEGGLAVAELDHRFEMPAVVCLQCERYPVGLARPLG